MAISMLLDQVAFISVYLAVIGLLNQACYIHASQCLQSITATIMFSTLHLNAFPRRFNIHNGFSGFKLNDCSRPNNCSYSLATF